MTNISSPTIVLSTLLETFINSDTKHDFLFLYQIHKTTHFHLQSDLYYPRYLGVLNFGLKTADNIGLTAFHRSWAYQILATKTADNRGPTVIEVLNIRLYMNHVQCSWLCSVQYI